MASYRRPLVVAPGALERARRLEGDASPEEVVVAYHERTKHHFHRYAASLGYMDWATQPDPFRRYAGAELVRLPLPSNGPPASLLAALRDRDRATGAAVRGVGLALLPVRTVSDGVEALP